MRSVTARHPDGTEVDPQAWWDALVAASTAAGGLHDVAAVSVAGQHAGWSPSTMLQASAPPGCTVVPLAERPAVN